VVVQDALTDSLKWPNISNIIQQYHECRYHRGFKYALRTHYQKSKQQILTARLRLAEHQANVVTDVHADI